jgi:hypothetical protein
VKTGPDMIEIIMMSHTDIVPIKLVNSRQSIAIGYNSDMRDNGSRYYSDI